MANSNSLAHNFVQWLNQWLFSIAIIFSGGGIILSLWALYADDKGYISVGLGFISIGLGLTARGAEVKSAERMKAFANVEFYERLEVLDDYYHNYQQREEVYLKPNIMAAIRLEPWLDLKQKHELKDKFDAVIKRLEDRHPAAHDNLQNLWIEHKIDQW